jgi:hypothetical protein
VIHKIKYAENDMAVNVCLDIEYIKHSNHAIFNYTHLSIMQFYDCIYTSHDCLRLLRMTVYAYFTWLSTPILHERIRLLHMTVYAYFAWLSTPILHDCLRLFYMNVYAYSTWQCKPTSHYYICLLHKTVCYNSHGCLCLLYMTVNIYFT